MALAAAPAAPQATNDSMDANNADSFLNALKNSSVRTINVTGDFSLKDKTLEKLLGDITIKSKDTKHKIDFNNEHLDGNGHSVTFENIDLYDVAKDGLVTGATTVNFNNNVSFHGKTLLNNGATTVNFNGKVDAEAVKMYNFNGSNTNVADDSSTGNTALLNVNQNVNFRNGSNVTLTTTDTAVMDFNAARVEEGAKVTLNEMFTKTVNQSSPEKYSALIAENYAAIVDGELTVNLLTQGSGQIGSFIYFKHINPASGLSMGNGHILFQSDGPLTEPLIDLSKNKDSNAVVPSNVGSNGNIELIAKNIGAYSGTIVNGDQLPIFTAKIHLVADGTGNIVGIKAFRGRHMSQADIDITENNNPESRAIELLQIIGSHGETKWLSDKEQPNAVPWDNMTLEFKEKGNPIIYSLDTYSKDQKIQPNDGHYLKRFYVKFVDTPNVVQITNGNFDLATDKLTGDITINPVIGNTSVDDAYIGVNIGKEDLNNKIVVANHYTITNNGEPVSHDTKYYIQPDEKMHFELDLKQYEDKITADAPITLKLMKEGYEFTATITLDQIKQAAKDAIEKARKDTEDRVGKLTFTGDDLKNENAQIDKDAKTATDKITAATTIDGIRQAENGGLKDIATDEKKAEAVSKIDQEAEKVKKEVQNLSPDEKTKATTNIDTDATNAKKDIQGAIDQTGIDKAQNDGITKIDRDGAIASVEDAAKKADAAIDSDKSLANDKATRDAAHAKVKQDKYEAEKLINQDTTEEKMKEDAAKGIKKINREQAKADIEHEAIKIKGEIDQDQYLSQDERNKEKEKIDPKVTKAEQEIDNAPDDGIDIAKNAGITDIDKTGAEAAVRNEAKKIEQDISADSYLTQPEREKYTRQTETDKDTAINNIEKADTVDKVDSAENEGLKQIDRDGAKAAIDNEAKKITQMIDDLPNIDSKTKQDADAQVEKDRQLYINNLDDPKQTSDQANIEKVKQAGIKKIDDDGNLAAKTDEDLKKAKEDAKKEVDKAADQAKQNIDKQDLTPDEKKTAKDKVDADKKEAYDNIDKGRSKEEINKAKEDGISKINKEQAKEEIEHEANKIKKEIDSDNSLSQEDKDKYKKQVDTDKTVAEDKIDKATTTDQVDKAKNDGLKKIDREGAKAAIDNEANKVEKEIDSLKNIDEQTKQKAKDQVEADRKKYKDEIDDDSKTPTQDDVNKVRDEGIKKIDEDGKIAADADNDIKKAKDDAKKALEDEANRAKQEIDKDANLTPEEKEQAKAKVDADKNEAEAKIDKADNKADIEKAKNEGISKIDKEHAKAAIEHEARKIEKEIAGRDSLTQEEKDKYKAQTEADKTRALDNIDRANTSDEVNKAMNDGLKQIDREGAKAAIDNEANKIIKKIDGMSDVDEETKTKAKAQVEADRKKYKAEIDDESKTPTQEAVNSVRDEGIRKIDEDGNIKGKPKGNNNGSSHGNTKAKKTSGKQTASKKRQQSSFNFRAGSGARKVLVANKGADSRRRLPQAGARNESLAAVAGLAIAAAGSLLGLGIGKKRREK